MNYTCWMTITLKVGCGFMPLSLSTLVNIFLKEKLSSDWAFLFFSDLLAFTGLANLLSFNPPPRATFILFGLSKLSNLHSLARQTFAVVVDFLSYTFFFLINTFFMFLVFWAWHDSQIWFSPIKSVSDFQYPPKTSLYDIYKNYTIYI